jgi:hypothetical protein
VINERPDISVQDLASSLGLPLGEALVIIHELKMEKTLESTR